MQVRSGMLCRCMQVYAGEDRIYIYESPGGLMVERRY